LFAATLLVLVLLLLMVVLLLPTGWLRRSGLWTWLSQRREVKVQVKTGHTQLLVRAARKD
jgi:hypothetical protein